MNKDEFIAILVMGIIFSAWAIYMEWRLYELKIRLINFEMRQIDAKIKTQVSALSDADLNSKLAKDLSVPSATK